MGYRMAEVECTVCNTRHDELVWVDHGKRLPKALDAYCMDCEDTTKHDRLMGAPARYMGEKQLSPAMYGGTYDTMGARELEPLPELPGAKEHSAKMRDRLRLLPNNATKAERMAAQVEACSDAPTSADYAEHFKSREWRDVWARNQKTTRENTQKQKRAAALARGENVNFRRDKCAGDPKMTA